MRGMDQVPPIIASRDVDAYYFIAGIAAVRELLEPAANLDPSASAVVREWLRRFDEPQLALNEQPKALRALLGG
jgi:hypothetical protein